MGLTQITTGGVDDNINIDSNTLKVDGTNNRVGIGTAAPSSPLHVNGGTVNTVARFESTDSKARIVLKDNSGECRIGAEGDDISFHTSSGENERMRITSSGDMQARRARSNTAGDVALSVQPSDSSIHYGLRVDTANNSLNLDRASGTAANLLAIDSSGKVLIGSTAGSVHGDRLLQVGKTDRSQTYISITNSSTGTGGLLFADTTTNDTGGYRGQVTYQHNGDAMVFSTAATERMRLDSSGRAMIGTSSNNGGFLTVDSGGVQNIAIRDNGIENHKYNGNAEIAINYNGYANGSTQFRDFRIYNGKNQHIATFEGSTRRLGIGTTSPSSTAHVKGGSLTVEHGSPSTGTCQFNINCENNSQASLSYDDQGSIVIGTAATPSNQGSFSEKLRVDSSGRVMVGLSGTPSTASLATLTGGNSSTYAYMFIAGGSVSNYKMLKAGGKFLTRTTAERNIDLVQAVQCSGNMNILITVKFKLNSATSGNNAEIFCRADMHATSSGNWSYGVKTPQKTEHFGSSYGVGSLAWVGGGTNTKILRYTTDSNAAYTNYMIEEIVITGYDNANTVLL